MNYIAGECVGCFADDSPFITRNEFSILDMEIENPYMTPQLCIKHCYGLSQAIYRLIYFCFFLEGREGGTPESPPEIGKIVG